MEPYSHACIRYWNFWCLVECLFLAIKFYCKRKSVQLSFESQWKNLLIRAAEDRRNVEHNYKYTKVEEKSEYRQFTYSGIFVPPPPPNPSNFKYFKLFCATFLRDLNYPGVYPAGKDEDRNQHFYGSRKTDFHFVTNDTMTSWGSKPRWASEVNGGKEKIQLWFRLISN